MATVMTSQWVRKWIAHEKLYCIHTISCLYRSSTHLARLALVLML